MNRAPYKPSLLFVDHDFHKKTRSFDFLIELLRDDFDVEVKYIDPSRTQNVDTLIDDSEYVVLAQMDFLTPHFIAAGKKVCVVQMYDGSAGLPDTHWQLNRQARYLNFSVALHARALAAGAQSHLVRYYPDPEKFKQVEDFSSFRGFFWQRLPKSRVNLSVVARMAGQHLDQLHVHLPADDGTPFDAAALDAFSCPVSTSSWFERFEDFKATLDEANVYFAPRLAEGIGHGFLEAMAKGMLVIAYDLPTHNEYINNWVSGILYNENVGELSFGDWQREAQRMSRNARAAVTNGHKIWKSSKESIVDFVRSTPAASVPKVAGINHALAEIERSYIAGLDTYRKTLDNFPKLRTMMSDWSDLEDELSHADHTETPGSTNKVHVFFGCGYAHPFMEKGWSGPELPHTWAVEEAATLKFPISRPARIERMQISARALARNTLSIRMGDRVIGSFTITDRFDAQEITFDRPVDLLAGETLSLTLSVSDDEGGVPGDPRSLRFAVRSITFDGSRGVMSA